MPRIFVCVKQALDVAELKIDSATRRPIIAGVPRKISDFDKNAIEEAVRIKEKIGAEVTIITVGLEEAKTTLREALAMGADKAYLIATQPLRIQTLWRSPTFSLRQSRNWERLI